MTAYRFIRSEEANHSVRLMCRVLKLARSCYYAWLDNEWHGEHVDSAMLVHIKAIHRQHKGRYGAPRITAELRAQGFVVNRKRVARLMRAQGLVGRPRRRFRGTTTDSVHDLPVAPNLLERAFCVEAPSMAIVGDITYLPTGEGWAYLAVLIDLFSRKVVGWSLESHMETSLCMAAMNQMVVTRGCLQGAIHHSDRGSQYASKAYRQALENVGMRQSMSRKGNCWDNAVAESFFGTLEQELVPDGPWANAAEARNAVSDYIHHYYNPSRRHSTLGYQSPIDFEQEHLASRNEAA